MTLFTKLALYNTLVRLALIGTLWLVLPLFINRVDYQYTDARLLLMHKRVLARIEQVGIEPFMNEVGEGRSNLLSQEFATLMPYKDTASQPDRRFFDRKQDGNATADYRVLSHLIRIKGQTYILEVGKNLSEIRELSQTLSQLALGIVAAILLLTFLIDLGYVHFLLRPLRLIINRKLRLIQEPGQFDFTPLPTSTRELSQLDTHINDLMRQLSVTFTREKAFASQASHELLTPITLLRTSIDNLIADEQTPPQVAVQLVESQRTLLRLSKLVQKLLRLARIENHQYLKNDTVSIWTVLDEVLNDLEDLIALKAIQVELVPGEDILVSPANQTLLYTMLSNLVGNAVRYNVKQGRLFIGQSRIGSNPTLTITDTGPGMTDEQVATLTQHGRPAQVMVESTGIDPHNGIGLQLIRTIARFHDIDLRVDSRLNQGTSITLCFVATK